MTVCTPDERIWLAFSHRDGQTPDRVPCYEGTIEIPELVAKPARLEPGILFFGASLVKNLAAPWGKPLRSIFSKVLSHPAVAISLLEPFVAPIFNSISSVHRKLKIDMMGGAGGLPMVLNPRIFDEIRVRDNVVYSPMGDIAMASAGGTGAVSRNGFLRSPADYERYMSFDPDSRVNTFITKRLLDATRGKIAVCFTVFGSAFFENLCEMFGYDALFKLLVRDPGFIKKAVKDMSDYATAVASRLLDQGARIFYMTDDLGQKGRSLISPRMYRAFFKDGIARFCKVVHKGGGKVMMHSDGNVMDLVPDFIDAGIDALHPWESAAGMDIFEGKHRWGEKLVLIGNVPIELLSHGTPGAVEAHVKDLMETVAPGGGFVISSSHSVVPSVKYENYRAYMLARLRFGTYPHLTSGSF
nr:uroporphyrinogen decarboxylase family protein [Candidatus Sigynarchaeota archaeon]